MTKVAALAAVTVREAVRQKLAVNLLVFTILVLAGATVISRLTFGEQYRIIVDVSLSAMELFGTLIAVFLGAGLVARDVERRAVYAIVAKPVSRAQYVAGRYLGLLATLVLNLLVMATVFAAVLAAYTGSLSFLGASPLGWVLASLVVRFAVVSALATLFSCFSTATLSAVFALSLVVAGQFSSDLLRYWTAAGRLAGALGAFAYVLLPNLEALNIKEAMVYKDAVPLRFAWDGLAYGSLYAGAVAFLAAAIFSRRDLR